MQDNIVTHSTNRANLASAAHYRLQFSYM